MKQVYQTNDGTIFEDQEQASTYEDECFESWLGANPVFPVNDFLNSLDNETGQEWINWTDQRIVTSYIRKYWESQLCVKTTDTTSSGERPVAVAERSQEP